MYYTNAKEIDKEQIMVIPFEYAPNTIKDFVVCKLGHNSNENTFVLYNTTEDAPIPLGYCSVDDLNITNSKYIETLLVNTANYADKNIDTDVYKRISKQMCIHISQWLFDDKLRDVEILKQIFSNLMEHIRAVGKYELIWCDGKENIIYYPIQDVDYYLGYLSSSTYFAQAFYKQ